MQRLWEYLVNSDLIEMLFRVVMATVAGGLVGVEREYHGRAAGMRTHILVSLGAALTAIIGVSLSVQMYETYGVVSDVQRTGAQVMSGVGFLGAGTILLKKSNSQIRGLTTAAGIWATAAIGLAVGYGLYVPAFLTVCAVVLVFTLMIRVENLVNHKRQRVFIYVEVDSVESVKIMAATLTERFSALEIQVTPPRSGTPGHVGMEALVRLPAKTSIPRKLEKLQALDHVIFALHIS